MRLMKASSHRTFSKSTLMLPFTADLMTMFTVRRGPEDHADIPASHS